MKKILLLVIALTLLVSTIYCQQKPYFTAKMGLNLGYISDENKYIVTSDDSFGTITKSKPDNEPKIGMGIGLSYNYPIVKRYSISADIDYNYLSSSSDLKGINYNYKTNVLNTALKGNINFLNDKISLGVGPALIIPITPIYITGNHLNGDIKVKSNKLNLINPAIKGNIIYNFNKTGVELNYLYGFSSIVKENESLMDDLNIRSLSLNILYKF